MKNKSSKKHLLAVIIIFLILFLSTGLKILYEKTEVESSNRILEKIPRGGLALTTSLKFYNKKNDAIGGIIFEARPGTEFAGSLIAKNHYDYDIKANFDITNPEKNDESDDPKVEKIEFLGQTVYKQSSPDETNQSGIEIEIIDNPGDFILKANQIKEFDYKISIPKETPLGAYTNGEISLLENTLKTTIHEGSLAYVTFGAAVSTKIIVTENPEQYKTDQKLPKKVSEIIKADFKQKLTLYAGIIFLILTMIFIYLGLRAKGKR